MYLGQLWPGSTCAMRMTALEQLGHDVTALDTTPTMAGRHVLARSIYRVVFRLGWPLDEGRINERLLNLYADLRPNVVWIDKGLVVTSRTLNQLRALRSDVILIHYNPDDPFGGFGYAGWRTFLGAIPDYDVHIVPRRANVAEYRDRRARQVFQALPAWGYAPDIHSPMAVDAGSLQRYRSDIGFVGSFEAERASQMLALADRGLQLRIVGAWPENFLVPAILHSPQAVFGIDYVKAMRSFKIALGFLRKKNRDQHTSRSIEIPACGVFMLAERSEEHLELFEEGSEAEFFASTEELVDKARFYLSNESAREKIAAAGRARCLRSRYDNSGCMERMLKQAGG